MDVHPAQNDPGGLFMTSLKGESPTATIVDFEWDNRAAVFSPDGTRLLFISNRSGHPDAWVLDLRNGAYRQVNTGRRWENESWSASWSPDGREIAVAQENLGYSDATYRIAIYPAP